MFSNSEQQILHINYLFIQHGHRLLANLHVFASINSENLRANLTFVDYTETDSSPPSSADVKNGWGYTYTPPYAFMACTWRTSPLYYTEVFVVMFSSQLIVKRNLQRTSAVNNFRYQLQNTGRLRRISYISMSYAYMNSTASHLITGSQVGQLPYLFRSLLYVTPNHCQFLNVTVKCF